LFICALGSAGHAERLSVTDGNGVTRQYVVGRRLNAGIDTGATSEVYLGHEVGSRTRITIKLMRPERVGEEDVRASFEREYTVMRTAQDNAARLGRRSNLPEAYGLGTHRDGRPFLVMEYIHGRPLGPTWTPFPRRYSFRSTVQIAKDVLDGLDEIHLQGKKHNDPQPANILTDGSRGRLIDFGTVSDVDAPYRGYHPSYFPASATGISSDLYAVGGLIYAMQTGRQPPPDFDSVPTERRRIKVAGLLGMDPYAPQVFDLSKVAAPLRPIVRKATDPDPRQRFQSATEFKVALDQALGARAR
jgi:serine/threonine-protein kinase